jgi:hypothetical protein
MHTHDMQGLFIVTHTGPSPQLIIQVYNPWHGYNIVGKHNLTMASSFVLRNGTVFSPTQVLTRMRVFTALAGLRIPPLN